MSDFTNILDLLDRDGVSTKKVSHRERCSPCPWCGGKDRFRVWPDEEGGGGFWCRVCNKGGDAIKYHMLATGKNYTDACYDLGIKPRKGSKKQYNKTFERCLPPSLVWRKIGDKFTRAAHDTLMSEKGAGMRSWLAERGILKQSIQKTRLGLNISDKYFERSTWGLPDEINENTSKPKKVWIPAGLVIPCFDGEDLIRIRVRRFNIAGDDSRYVVISGSSKKPMRLGHLEERDGKRIENVTVVESELDGILVSQNAGDFTAVLGLGSASLRPDIETHYLLQATPKILLALDYDAAGDKQSRWWQRQYGAKARRWPAPSGKDPGEAHQNGENIRTWILASQVDLSQYPKNASKG